MGVETGLLEPEEEHSFGSSALLPSMATTPSPLTAHTPELSREETDEGRSSMENLSRPGPSSCLKRTIDQTIEPLITQVDPQCDTTSPRLTIPLPSPTPSFSSQTQTPELEPSSVGTRSGRRRRTYVGTPEQQPSASIERRATLRKREAPNVQKSQGGRGGF